MSQFKVILLIACLEVYRGFAYQCPKSIPYSTIPGLSSVSLPVSEALHHFKFKNEFLIDSNGRTRYVCVEVTPEIYALQNKTINNQTDMYVQIGGDCIRHIIPHFLGGSNDSLNVFSFNQNCNSELLNISVEQKLAELLTEHSLLTYIVELEYTHDATDAWPTCLNAVYMDENENILGSMKMTNSPSNTPYETEDQEISSKSKRSLTDNSKHPKNPTITKNCRDGCFKSECWLKVEERDHRCRSFHTVHANTICDGEWCYCCSYY